MRARVLPAALALSFAVAACTGGGGEAEPRFETSPGAAAATRTPDTRPTSASIKAPPAARMFAGSQSSEGALEIYCEGDQCAARREDRPESYLTAPESGFVVFAVHKAPSHARVETLRRGDDGPATTELSPGTTMLFPVRMPAGSYLVTLAVRWKDAEARWLFGIKVGATRSPG